MSNQLIQILQPASNQPVTQVFPGLASPHTLVGTTSLLIPYVVLTLNNLQVYYDLSQSGAVSLSGSNITGLKDISLNSHDGTVDAGTPTYSVADQNGLNVGITDSNTIITITNSVFDVPKATIGFVLKTPTSFAASSSYLFDSPGSGTNFDLYLSNAATGQLQADAGTLNDATITAGTNLLSASTWYRVIVVWDSSQSNANNRLKLYLNGTDITTVSQTGQGNNTNTSNASILNNSHTSGVAAIIHLGEFVYTTDAITSQQITNLNTYWSSKWNI